MHAGELTQLMKKSAAVARLYRSAHFYASAPMRDIFDIEKARIIRSVRPYTMLSWRELSALYDAVCSLDRERIPGNVVECGVCNGGSAGVLASSADANRGRDMWMFDSWEGLPEPGENDVNAWGQKGLKGQCAGSQECVQQLFHRRLQLSHRRQHFVKGWFANTLPAMKAEIGKIALLHIDGDWYESVRVCLDELYDQVVPGGYIFVDDYGYWKGAQQAVDDFVAKHAIGSALTKVDGTAAYLRKC